MVLYVSFVSNFRTVVSADEWCVSRGLASTAGGAIGTVGLEPRNSSFSPQCKTPRSAYSHSCCVSSLTRMFKGAFLEVESRDKTLPEFGRVLRPNRRVFSCVFATHRDSVKCIIRSSRGLCLTTSNVFSTIIRSFNPSGVIVSAEDAATFLSGGSVVSRLNLKEWFRRFALVRIIGGRTQNSGYSVYTRVVSIKFADFIPPRCDSSRFFDALVVSVRTPQIFNKQTRTVYESRELYTLCFQQTLELRSWVDESIQRIHDQKEPIRGR